MKVKRKNKASIPPWGNNLGYHFGSLPSNTFPMYIFKKLFLMKLLSTFFIKYCHEHVPILFNMAQKYNCNVYVKSPSSG